MRWSQEIARQGSMRLGVVALFALCALGCTLPVVLLGGSVATMAAVQVVIAGSGVVAFLAPSDRMDARWFLALPILIAVETTAAMLVLAPHGGAVAIIGGFNGPLVCWLVADRVQMVALLAFTSLALLVPVAVGATDEESTVVIVAVIGLMWSLGLSARYVWGHAEHQAELLSRLADHDPLTGLANRRRLDEQMAYEFARHRRTDRRLSLLVLDLNDFKTINDTLGHQAGDDVLCSAAAALAGAVRPRDLVARQGGDEFCVLAPETDAPEAAELASLIKVALARVQAAGAPLRTAIGHATFPDDGVTADDLLRTADNRQREDKPTPEHLRRFPAVTR